MLAFASIFAAIIPMVTYLFIIWWMDRNERDPFWIVFLNFFWGATGAIILGIIGSLIFQIPLSLGLWAFFGENAGGLTDLSRAVITAPLVEELTKVYNDYREKLGDTLTNTPGSERRPCGYNENPVTLTVYDPDHPYYIAEYDKNDVG